LFLGWLLGRRRRSSGLPVFLVLMGALSCLVALPTIVFGPVFGWTRAREVASLANPEEPAELRALASGTRVLITAQIPPDSPPGPYGLALYYVEYRQPGTPNPTVEAGTATATPQWQREKLPPKGIELLLSSGQPLSVQFSSQTAFLNAQRFEEEVVESPVSRGRERRYVGYLPGQALTVEGTWEGGGLLTARTCYAGTPGDYSAYLARQPWIMLAAGGACGGLGVSLVVVGLVLRLLGR
jgi:hypothetical protein